MHRPQDSRRNQGTFKLILVLLIAVCAFWYLLRHAQLLGSVSQFQDTDTEEPSTPEVDQSMFDQSKLLNSCTTPDCPGYGANQAAEYVTTVPDPEMRAQKEKVDAYLNSTEFAAYRAKLAKTPFLKGILVNAGGPKYLPGLVVMLKVLREHFKCSLPVEVAWNSAEGLDNVTVATLDDQYGPVYALYLNQRPPPKHHRQNATLEKWAGKIYSLLHTRFKEVLYIDADAVPLRDPFVLFDEPAYRESGNLFWPDAWIGWSLTKEGYELVGLDPTLASTALQKGKRFSHRETESGLFVLDRHRHADVLQYLWWANSFHEQLYKKLWGDKDSFPLAFGLARKAHLFRQMHIPPGGVFTWGEANQNVQFIQNNSQIDGWELLGFLQYNSRVQPAVMHLTMKKFNMISHNPPVQLITPPMPHWWGKYWLDWHGYGLTKPTPGRGVLAAPDFAFQKLTVPLAAMRHVWGEKAELQEQELEECPLAQLAHTILMIKLALPVDIPPDLLQHCAAEVRMLLSLGTKGAAATWGERENFRKLGKKQGEEAEDNVEAEVAELESRLERLRFTFIKEEYLEGGTDMQAGFMESKPLSLPALRLTPEASSDTIQAIEVVYEAHDWLKNANLTDLPALVQ